MQLKGSRKKCLIPAPVTLSCSAAYMSSEMQICSHHPSPPGVIPLLPATAPTEGSGTAPGWSQKEQHTPERALRREEAALFSLVLGTLGDAHLRNRRGRMVTCHLRSHSESTHGLVTPWACRTVGFWGLVPSNQCHSDQTAF